MDYQKKIKLSAEAAGSICVHLKCGFECKTLEVDKGASVEGLRMAAAVEFSTDPELMQLFFGMSFLKDDTAILSDLGVADGATVSVVIKPPTVVKPPVPWRVFAHYDSPEEMLQMFNSPRLENLITNPESFYRFLAQIIDQSDPLVKAFFKANPALMTVNNKEIVKKIFAIDKGYAELMSLVKADPALSSLTAEIVITFAEQVLGPALLPPSPVSRQMQQFYRKQEAEEGRKLAKLAAVGFVNREANIKALAAAGGHLKIAITLLVHWSLNVNVVLRDSTPKKEFL